MPPSYFEKLLWSFIKNKFFGGIFLFLKLDTIPLTAALVLTFIIEYYLNIHAVLVPLWAFTLILIGYLTRKVQVRFIHSLILATITMISLYVSYSYTINLTILDGLSVETYKIAIYAFIFTWFLSNSILLIIQVAEFFASTVGLYLLWGSDKKRIFLSPLPQLAILGMVYLGLKSFTIDDSATILISLNIMIVLSLIYIFLRNAGRITRNAVAMYVFFEAYILAGYLYRFQVSQNILAWVILTLLATFFTAQGRAAIIAKEKKGVNGNIILLIGILLLIGHVLMPINKNTFIEFEMWWLLSTVATIIAPIGFSIYIMATGKYKWYLKRDDIQTHKLFIEVFKIVGTKLMNEMIKILSSSFTNIAKSFRSSEND